MKDHVSLQERLKDLRVEKGLKLEELAEKTGISKSALASYGKCTRYVPDILLYRSWKIPLSSQKGCGWLVVAFYDSKGRQHFRLSLLDCLTAKPGGAVNGGRSPFILTVDWLGRVCYLSGKLEFILSYHVLPF